MQLVPPLEPMMSAVLASPVGSYAYSIL